MGEPRDCKYFRIVDWDKKQAHPNHRERLRYTDFMLSSDILYDPKIVGMTNVQFAFWVKLHALSRQLDGVIPNNPAFLARVCGAFAHKRSADLSYLWVLGLIEAADPLPKDKDKDKDKDKASIASLTGPSSSSAGSKEINANDQEELRKSWNLHNPKNTSNGFFGARTELVVRSLQENPDLGYWDGVFRRVGQSKFLSDSKKKWKTTLDWALKNHVKISEGVFDNHEAQTPIPQNAIRIGGNE